MDVRKPAEFKEGSIGNYCNVPRGQLELKVGPTYVAWEKPFLDYGPEIPAYLIMGGRSTLAACPFELGYQNAMNIDAVLKNFRGDPMLSCRPFP